MRLDTSLLDGISAAKTAKASSPSTQKTSGSTSFTSALKAATSSDAGTSTAKVPSGETSKAVAGHSYADIVTGPRAGMYVNTSGNARDGQAFVLVRRNGREDHIYGTGKDRVVIGLKPHKDTPTTTTKTDAPTAPAPTTNVAPTP